MKQLPIANPDKYLPMPNGLEGYWWETDKLVCVPVVIATREGAFSNFLKSIEAKPKIIFFPTIINAKLDTLLRARGYEEAFTTDEIFGLVEGLAKFPKEVICT